MNSSPPVLRACVVAVVVLFLCHEPATSQQQPRGANAKKARSPVLQIDGIFSYKAWLQQDVVWIITDEERAAFKRLTNDEERDNFIDAFWARRDPTPDTFENEFKEEHYRRIVYANDHFGARAPGWKSDRGRMYIMFGPPDQIESYATRDEDKTPGVDPSSYPLEVWHYQYIEGIGKDVTLEFVDGCKCGEYNMPITPITTVRAQDINRSDGYSLESQLTHPKPVAPIPSGLVKTPRIRFKNLEEKAIIRPKGNKLPFNVTTHTEKVTDFTSLVPVTISFRKRDLTFVENNGSHRATLNIFGRVRSLTGRVVDVFEDTFDVGDVPKSSIGSAAEPAVYTTTLVLRTGYYRIDIAVQDENNTEHWATYVGPLKPRDH